MSEREAAVIAEQISIMRAEMGGGSAPYLHSPLGDVCDFYTYLEDEHGIRRKVIPFEHAEENAARIMALWNATLGIPTADLPALSASLERERVLRDALECLLGKMNESDMWGALTIRASNAKHAPQPEATPATAADGEGEVRYACSKVAAVGDTVKVIGSNPPLHMKVEEIGPTGGLYIKSLTGTACMLLNSSQVEFVPEVGPGGVQATTPKWPRYFASSVTPHDKSIIRVYHADGSCGWADGSADPMTTPLADAIRDDIETDAEGNTLPASPATGAASGVERFSDLLFELRTALSISDKYGGTERTNNAVESLERFAADHDRLLAERDGEIAELEKERDDARYSLAEQSEELVSLKEVNASYDEKLSHARNAIRETEAQLAELRAANERMRDALQMLVDDVTERHDMDSPSTNPGMKVAVKHAQAALAAGETGVGE